MKEKKIEVIFVDPELLTPYVNNTKLHPISQIDKIAQQIAEFGFDQPIVVDKDYVIIKGHGRREASIRLGLKEVPTVVRDDLDEYQVKAERIGDNKVAESDWDNDVLKFELGTLERNGFVDITGFDSKEIDKILNEDDDIVQDIGDIKVKDQFIVSVECDNEDTQQSVYNRLTEEGYSCKLIS